MTQISMIAAVTADLGLGRDGRLLYHISDDLKRFKSITLGHPVVMGRKTFESFPNGPLPGRLNVVLTRDDRYTVPDWAVKVGSVDEAINTVGDTEAMVIGGGEIYRQFLPLAHRVYLTVIDAKTDADTYFPALEPSQWTLAGQSEPHTDPRSGVVYRFLTYERIKQ